MIPVPSLSNSLKIWFAKSLALCLGIAYMSSMFSLFITPSGQTAMKPLEFNPYKQPHNIRTMQGWIYCWKFANKDLTQSFIADNRLIITLTSGAGIHIPGNFSLYWVCFLPVPLPDLLLIVSGVMFQVSDVLLCQPDVLLASSKSLPHRPLFN